MNKPKHRKAQIRYYLVEFWGLVEPAVLGKSHRSYERLLKAARILYASSSKFTNGENILCYIKVVNRVPSIHSFSNEELDNDEAEDQVIADNIQKGKNPFGLETSL